MSASETKHSEMEPDCTSGSELADVLAELSRRGPISHRPEIGTSRADFEKMVAPDFW